MDRSLRKILFLCMLCLTFALGASKQASAKEAGAVESLTVSVGKKGFHPSSGNYLRIKSYVNAANRTGVVRLRIYNDVGQFVFQKLYANSTGGYIDYKWKGKPSKDNAAGLSTSKYVKNGSYTAEVSLIFEGNEEPVSQKACGFKVSSKAESGKQGLAMAKTAPILTGNPEVDYMAEQICKAAKIKDSQSDREKVRRIYHWMTKNQKHVHYQTSGSYKTYYKLSSSQKKIESYRKLTDKRYKKGKLIYRYDYNLIRRSWCMERRIGECTDHAAIFKILCNHVGVEAGICSGYYLNRNGTRPPHSWNYAVVDGMTYYYDVDVEIQNYGKGQGDYYWYQKTKEEAKLTHQFVTTD